MTERYAYLWDALDNGTALAIDALVEAHIPMVHTIASSISLPAHSILDYEDLVQHGLIGLLDAIKKYDRSRDNKFITYAYRRIHGAIVDALRSIDEVGRVKRSHIKKIDEARQAILSESNASIATDQDLLSATGLSELRYKNTKAAMRFKIISIHEDQDGKTFELTDKEQSPIDSIQNKEQWELILRGFVRLIELTKLTEQERAVFVMRHFDGILFKNIAFEFGISEGRASQIHKEAMRKILHQLDHYDEPYQATLFCGYLPTGEKAC